MLKLRKKHVTRADGGRMDYSELLKLARKQTGMSQVEFAKYFKLPRRTYQDWEYGKNPIPEYMIRLMLYKLKMEGKTGDLSNHLSDEKQEGEKDERLYCKRGSIYTIEEI